VKRPEVDWPRANIASNIAANIGTKTSNCHDWNGSKCRRTTTLFGTGILRRSQRHIIRKPSRSSRMGKAADCRPVSIGRVGSNPRFDTRNFSFCEAFFCRGYSLDIVQEVKTTAVPVWSQWAHRQTASTLSSID
jgi:hypothetical protein